MPGPSTEPRGRRVTQSRADFTWNTAGAGSHPSPRPRHTTTNNVVLINKCNALYILTHWPPLLGGIQIEPQARPFHLLFFTPLYRDVTSLLIRRRGKRDIGTIIHIKAEGTFYTVHTRLSVNNSCAYLAASLCFLNITKD